jgi:hypothetical protein
MHEQSKVRVAGIAAVAGAALALVGNLLHPRYGNDPDFVNYGRIAGSDRLRAADFVLLLAMALIIPGMIGIARWVRSERGDVVSHQARLAATIGGTIALAQLGIETFALKQQAALFVSTNETDRVGAFWATNAIDHLSTALFNTWTIVLLGLTPLAIGIAALRSHRHPTWIAAIALLGGASCLVTGCVNLARVDQSSMEIPFLVGSLLVTAWLLAAGTAMLRADDQKRAPAAEAA